MSKHIRFDWAMKRLLRQKSNFVILEGFLSELLSEDITIAEILESESNKEEADDKFNRVDILVKNSQGELMLVEVQNERERDYFHRMNYGQAKLLTENIKEGDQYEKIKKIYSINIVYFELGQGKDYIYKGKTQFQGIHFNDVLQLSNNQKKAYNLKEVSDVFTNYYILKVNNFDKIAENTLDEWIYFLKNSEIKDSFKAKGLPEAKEKLRIDELTDEQKVSYKIFIKAKRIQENEITTAKHDGFLEAEQKYEPLLKQKNLKIEQEKKKAEQEKKKAEQEKKKAEQKEAQITSMIIKMKQSGMTNQQISQITGKTEKEIDELTTKT